MSDKRKAEKQPGLLARLREALSRTRQQVTGGLGRLLLGRRQLDESLQEELETRLLLADVGASAAGEILSGLTEKLGQKELSDPRIILDTLKTLLVERLKPVAEPLSLTAASPFVILTVGVNGAGKTTTIGKLASRFRQAGKSVLLAAGDTYRAAATEQLRVWSERADAQFVSQGQGADSASVIYDALSAAKARSTDVMIADTAGRLQTKKPLMEELRKVRRVMQKLDPQKPDETLLVLDATTGQNALVQAREFVEAVEVSGLVLTRLDGTAKGGIIFAIARELALPIRFIGVGEGVSDLREFDPEAFVDALLYEEGAGEL